MRSYKLLYSAVAASIALTPLLAFATTDTNAQVAANVPYSTVTELHFQASERRLNYGDDPLQFIELWSGGTATTPLIIFIHGGCWLNAYDIKHTYAATSALQRAGYAVASIEYRRTGDNGGGWPGTWHDIQQALKTLGEAPSLHLQQRKVIAMGHSAGGHLALLAGNTFPDTIDHVVGLAAITDLASYTAADGGCQQAGAQFMADATAQDWQTANPSTQAVNLNVTLLQGKADSIVPIEQATDYADHNLVELVLQDQAGHFDWVHPGTAAWQQLLTTLESIND
ncbi:alpha/beta fold hydrolase [Pseudidiomarina sp. E22-M8]|uniref:alpha/beta fold hydrolase n=1 Tax=Pseudidiomarina sp. E22-M8 TaxID=3424768 RepID=UPI00403CFC5B